MDLAKAGALIILLLIRPIALQLRCGSNTSWAVITAIMGFAFIIFGFRTHSGMADRGGLTFACKTIICVSENMALPFVLVLYLYTLKFQAKTCGFM